MTRLIGGRGIQDALPQKSLAYHGFESPQNFEADCHRPEVRALAGNGQCPLPNEACQFLEENLLVLDKSIMLLVCMS